MSLPNRSAPKLRTKRGCTACRTRRKKCDETKPSCSGCTKLHIICVWPSAATLIDRREKASSCSRWLTRPTDAQILDNEDAERAENSPLGDTHCKAIVFDLKYRVVVTFPDLRNSAQIFLHTDREVILWSHFFDLFLPANILPRAHPKFSRLHLGDVPELRYCMLACSSVQLSNRLGKSSEEALPYYTRTMSGLRKKLSSNEITGHEDWVFVVMILCHIFETWRCDTTSSVSNSIQHLFGAIQLLHIRCTSLDNELNHDLFLLMTESILFHVSTFLASTTAEQVLDIDTEAWKSLWQWIAIILNHPEENLHADIDNHPVLATPWELNRIIFEVSKLTTRRRMLDKVTTSEIQLLDALDDLENRPSAVPDSYALIRQLYIICARLLLSKSANSCDGREDNASEETQTSVRRALSIVVEMEETLECWTFMMRWPLIILGRIVQDDADRIIVESGLEKLWQISSCGDVRRGLQAIKAMHNSSVDIVQAIAANEV